MYGAIIIINSNCTIGNISINIRIQRKQIIVN